MFGASAKLHVYFEMGVYTDVVCFMGAYPGRNAQEIFEAAVEYKGQLSTQNKFYMLSWAVSIIAGQWQENLIVSG